MKMILSIVLVFLYAGSMNPNNLASGNLLQPAPCGDSIHQDEVNRICDVACTNCTTGCLNVANTLCQAACSQVAFKVSTTCSILADILILSSQLTPNTCGYATVPPQNLTICHEACRCCGVQDPECEQKCQGSVFFFAGITTCKIFSGTLSALGLSGLGLARE